MRFKVYSSPSNPWAGAPSNRACSTRASSSSPSRGVGPVGPRPTRAPVPPVFQAACQVLAGDLGGVHASGEQFGGAQPAGLKLLALAVGLGAAGRGRHRVLLCSGGRSPIAHHVNPTPKSL